MMSRVFLIVAVAPTATPVRGTVAEVTDADSGPADALPSRVRFQAPGAGGGRLLYTIPCDCKWKYGLVKKRDTGCVTRIGG